MEQIRAYFNNFLPLTDNEWEDFSSCFKKETYAKKEYLVRAGESCDFIAFIAEGVYRFYYLQEGEEKVTACHCRCIQRFSLLKTAYILSLWSSLNPTFSSYQSTSLSIF
jgi:CRP-like cAMP-binding protein